MDIERILKQIKSHFPYDNVGILLCEDGSGRIIKNTILHPYDDENLLFSFGSPAHLETYLEYLKDSPNP